MTEADNPLKMLITSFREAFAEWLLGSTPQSVQPLNVELPAGATHSDLLFEVLQASHQRVYLHIELQGRRSHEPMPWRMLDYMARLAKRELGEKPPNNLIRLHSVVIYVGQGAGVEDNGHYQLLDADDQMSLAWHYHSFRLWQMEAEELIALGKPALFPLIGQTRLENPEEILPQVLSGIRQVKDENQRSRLLTALTSLINSEETIIMVERMLEESEELLDTPYLRRIRQQGVEEGIAKGVLVGLRDAILEAIIHRFNPPARHYLEVSKQLGKIEEREILQRLLAVAIEVEDMAAFDSRLTQEVSTL